MAKLSARGRTELARVSKEINFPPSERKSYETIWERKEYVLMSDGHVLSRLTAKWSDGQRKLWQYNDCGKTLHTAESFKAHFESKGFTVVS